MAAKADFTPEAWTALRNTPHLIAATMVLAGQSGITGTFQESFATAQGMYEGLTGGNPLIRELAATEEARAAQEFLRGQVSLGVPAEQITAKVRGLATENLDRALAALAAKGSPADLNDYKSWVYGIANKIASAAKEGAFLGFGGERISDAEEALLKDLGAKLQITPPPGAGAST
jgi:hypothetical protein